MDAPLFTATTPERWRELCLKFLERQRKEGPVLGADEQSEANASPRPKDRLFAELAEQSEDDGDG